jgi:thymidylate synthase (FAD)
MPGESGMSLDDLHNDHHFAENFDLKARQVREIPLLNHGYVALTDTMGDDRTAAKTARTSFRVKHEKTEAEDQRLTRFLVREGHTTPLEFCQLRFYLKMPIFVARQLIRHRTASVNEISLRYVTAKPEFYIPALDRMNKPHESKKQGSSKELIDDPDAARGEIILAGEACFAAYERLLAAGLAPEIARTVLPLGTYTEWYWQTDLHNFLGMLGKRIKPDAQEEIRVYADAMLSLARGHFPTAIRAWEEKC